jgi:hypothetical protein
VREQLVAAGVLEGTENSASYNISYFEVPYSPLLGVRCIQRLGSSAVAVVLALCGGFCIDADGVRTRLWTGTTEKRGMWRRAGRVVVTVMKGDRNADVQRRSAPTASSRRC